jgi:hypothetical protein
MPGCTSRWTREHPVNLNLDLNRHLKSLVTLSALALLLVAGIAWGWQAMSSPFPKKAAARACYPTHVTAGSRISAAQLAVSVYNASARVGLAERTMTAFEDQGFTPGDVGNAPKGSVVPFAQVWNTHPNRPDVQLVLSRLGPNAHVIARHYRGEGIVVVVGDGYDDLVAGLSSVKVTHDLTICSPSDG